MNRKELYERVMQKADTEGTSINAAEVSRVCSLLLEELKVELKPTYGKLVLGDEEEPIVDYDDEVADSIIIDLILQLDEET